MDRRQQKTRRAIFRAFAALLARKAASAITVQEIIDEANVGRATFYAHFETKEHLLEAMCEEVFSQALSADGQACDTPDAAFRRLLEHLQDKDNPLLALFSCPNNDLLIPYFKQYLRAHIRAEARRAGWQFAPAIPEDYAVNYIAAAFVETVRWWMDSRPDRSAQVIAEYFRTAVQPLLAS